MKIKSKIRTHWKAHRWYIVAVVMLAAMNAAISICVIELANDYGNKLEQARGKVWLVSNAYCDAIIIETELGTNEAAQAMKDSFILNNLRRAFLILDSIPLGRPKR